MSRRPGEWRPVTMCFALVLVMACARQGPGGENSATPTAPAVPVATASATANPATTTASPSNTAGSAGRIAFNVEWGPHGDDYKDVYTISPGGSDVRQLTHVDHGLAADPAWAPSGDRLFYVGGAGDSTNLFAMDPDGASVQQLTFGPGFAESPAVSPDGNLVAFSYQADGPAAIYVVASDGSDLHRVSDPPSAGLDGDRFPHFAPDGKSLTFTRDGVILITAVDGTGTRPLTDPSDPIDDLRLPHWSPDGRSIVFSDSAGVQLLDVQSGSIQRIANGGDPAWSPDGSYICFHRYTLGTNYIALVVAQPDGSGATEIWTTPPSTDNFIVACAWGSGI